MSINECLRGESEINQAIVELAKKGLSGHPTCPAKSWDLEKAINAMNILFAIKEKTYSFQEPLGILYLSRSFDRLGWALPCL